jgi:hypothetical protein
LRPLSAEREMKNAAKMHSKERVASTKAKGD